MPAILAGRVDAQSGRGRNPDRHASNRLQAVSAPDPNGDTTPKPVTTTRRMQVT
jgi:hypothetical protein